MTTRETAEERVVLLLNGTNEPYVVVLGDGTRLVLAPGVFEPRVLGLGRHTIQIVRRSGKVIDVVADNSDPVFAFFNRSRTEIVNPDGCGVLVVDEREYTISRAAPDRQILHYGKTAQALDVDFIDVPFPDAVTVPGNVARKKRLSTVPLAEGLELIDAIDGKETHALIARRCATWATPG